VRLYRVSKKRVDEYPALSFIPVPLFLPTNLANLDICKVAWPIRDVVCVDGVIR
jgi:hypothetical protein